MDHRDIAIFKNKPNGFHESSFLAKSFHVPVPIEIGVINTRNLKLSTQEGLEDYKELESLAKSGNYKEALEKHIWFHEASRNFDSMGGVRLSYALDMWLELANKYPPAMDSLIALRDKYKKVLLRGEGGFEEFHDLSSINEALDEKTDTYNLFLAMHDSYPEQASRYYNVVEELLVERKDYDICAVYISSPLEKYDQIQELHKLNLKLVNENPVMNTDEFKSYTKESFTEDVKQLIEILTLINKEDVAEEIKIKAFNYSGYDEFKVDKYN